MFAMSICLRLPQYPSKRWRAGIDFNLDYSINYVSAIASGNPVTLLAGVHVGCYELFAREGIRTIADLKGKSVGVGAVRSVGKLARDDDGRPCRARPCQGHRLGDRPSADPAALGLVVDDKDDAAAVNVLPDRRRQPRTVDGLGQELGARRHLDRLGWEVAETEDGAGALLWLSQNPRPAMILLDLLMRRPPSQSDSRGG
jgi:hypothetical protein